MARRYFKSFYWQDYITHEKIRKEYGWKNLTKKRIEQVVEYLKGEVETYDNYLQNQVYGFIVKKNGVTIDEDGEIDDVLDSCLGFYGYDHKKSGLLDHAEDAIDGLIRAELDKHGIQEKLELA